MASSLLTLVTALLFAGATMASPREHGIVASRLLRESTPSDKPRFQWNLNPNFNRTNQPGEINLARRGYLLQPLNNIQGDSRIVFEEAARSKPNRGTIISFDIKTQVGCFVYGCHMTTRWWVFTREECYCDELARKPNQPDGSALLNFEGTYYDNLPDGELYLYFMQENGFKTGVPCTFDVVSGAKIVL